MKYYYKLRDNVIVMLGKSKKVQSGCVEITKEQYDFYKMIISSIPDREGHNKKVTLYIDGTYDVEYTVVE